MGHTIVSSGWNSKQVRHKVCFPSIEGGEAELSREGGGDVIGEILIAVETAREEEANPA